ncbi:hypothetical protein GOBAR_DD28241 [Gossypium barbadense]|nr:hypothetical protein GOBAR_DD28241 [Gossypium barbadense]
MENDLESEGAITNKKGRNLVIFTNQHLSTDDIAMTSWSWAMMSIKAGVILWEQNSVGWEKPPVILDGVRIAWDKGVRRLLVESDSKRALETILGIVKIGTHKVGLESCSWMKRDW